MNKVAATTQTRFSPATEDYVKSIYVLQQEHGSATTSLLALHLGLTPASVSGMLLKLQKLDLVRYTPYHGVILTDRGEQTALEVLRHHRLLETFLVKTLKYSWDEVHAEAEVLEHAISERLEARIAEHLGHPVTDPHGDPIPLPDLTLPACAYEALDKLPLGASARIVRITDQDPARLRYLHELGLRPDANVILQARAPFDGPVTVMVADTVHPIDSRLASAILVRIETDEIEA